MTLEIYYTADVVLPDGSNTSAYGEPCEEGSGYGMFSGWCDPGTSSYSWGTRENIEDVLSDDWERDDGNKILWLAETIIDRLQWVEIEGQQGGTFYGAHTDKHPYLGVEVTVQAHVYGATERQLHLVRTEIARMQERVTRG